MIISTEAELGYWLAPPPLREAGFFPYACDHDHELVAWISDDIRPPCWFCGRVRTVRLIKSFLTLV